MFFNIILFCAVFSAGFAAPNPKDNVKLTHDSSIAIKNSMVKCSTPKYPADVIVKLFESGQVGDDKEFRELVFCGLQETGFALEDGTVDVAKVSHIFPDPSKGIKIIEDCNKKIGKPEDNSYNFFKCMQTTLPFFLKLDL